MRGCTACSTGATSRLAPCSRCDGDRVSVFIGSGFVAQYPEGGGNFWVPLQYLLGFQALGVDAYWVDSYGPGAVQTGIGPASRPSSPTARPSVCATGSSSCTCPRARRERTPSGGSGTGCRSARCGSARATDCSSTWPTVSARGCGRHSPAPHWSISTPASSRSGPARTTSAWAATTCTSPSAGTSGSPPAGFRRARSRGAPSGRPSTSRPGPTAGHRAIGTPR